LLFAWFKGGGDPKTLEVQASLKRGLFTLKAEINDSGFICLSGLNGSGKSTLLNVIAGILKPDEGFVKVDSKDVTKKPMEQRGVVLVNPDSLIPNLVVDRHLVWGASAKKIQVDGRAIRRIKENLGISYLGRVDRLSLGMKERVSLATALLSKPEVILVDEAFSNIDHREDFIKTFASLCKSESIDLMHTTQRAEDALLADHHYELVAGTSSRIF
jgi:molybdate/tungstate transport system ATP-binding protein